MTNPVLFNKSQIYWKIFFLYFKNQEHKWISGTVATAIKNTKVVALFFLNGSKVIENQSLLYFIP